MSSSQARRVRVLVEAPASFSFSVRETAALSECEVVHCPGPQPGRPCPLLEGRRCTAVDQADVVVANLGLDTDEGRAILGGLHALHPDIPVVALAWHADLVRHAELLADSQVVEFPWTLSKLRTAVRDAAGVRPAEVEFALSR